MKEDHTAGNEEQQQKKRIRRLSVVLFIISLSQKSYCTTTSCSDAVMVFLLGWAALFSTGAGVCWLANPLLISGWLLIKKNLRMAMFFSVAATLLSLFFLIFPAIIDNESNIPHPIVSYKAGYWLWVLSNVTLLIGTCLLMYRSNIRNKTVTCPRHF